MKPIIVSTLLIMFATSAPRAEISLEKVATPCGTLQEVHDLLRINMPNPQSIAKGGDSRGNDIAILLTGDNYWALVATLSATRLCIVASGRNWTVIEPKAF